MSCECEGYGTGPCTCEEGGKAVVPQVKQFQREDRYLVLKRRDIGNALTELERNILFDISEKVFNYRVLLMEKNGLECVVVESDWPEFEPIWDAIQRRMEGRPAREAELQEEIAELSQHVCSECDPENYGWVFNRVEGKAVCGCIQEAEPFQILEGALSRIQQAATGEIQVADNDTDGMAWIAKEALAALRLVLPLEYSAEAVRT